jgi:hypothetical protein
VSDVADCIELGKKLNYHYCGWTRR